VAGRNNAAKTNSTFVDYFAATVDAQGFFKEGFTNDGLHPNAKGLRADDASRGGGDPEGRYA
jgi:lysophospholipase L1-like esterase